jgi:hypothetical protein
MTTLHNNNNQLNLEQDSSEQSQPQTEVEDDSWDMDDYPTYVSHNHYRNSL